MIRLRLCAALISLSATMPSLIAADPPADVLLPNDAAKIPFAKDVPIEFVTRGQNKAVWESLSSFWNEGTQTAIDPSTGANVTRKTIRIKVPLGLDSPPPIPAENPMTLAKWELGKKLYFDPILSTDQSTSCASCHNPQKGYGDRSQFSTGIAGNIGGANAPTVINSAYHPRQFWDGRAASLEDQAQGPVGNPKEMFGGKADAWTEAIGRVRANPEYVKQFEAVFGHAPTRDAAAKAIAAYERTVLSGNSLHDRAGIAMRKRIAEDESKPELTAADYATVLKDAFKAKDENALSALGLDVAKDADKADEMGKKIVNGRNLFFTKARCSNCHVGDNFSDGLFHNLGVGAEKGVLPPAEFGRFAAQALGHKDINQIGAFKTPGLRSLVTSLPYLHNGAEKTLEAVVDFYDRGGNVNEFLSPKMRDEAAEQAYVKARAEGKPVDPAVVTYGAAKKPVIPFLLKLTPSEKADLVLFLKALQGDPIAREVADSKWSPSVSK
ncbi:MAG: cytochrome c peroxidase [Gemmataceae bacterium]